jgi:hypothetical protein
MLMVKPGSHITHLLTKMAVKRDLDDEQNVLAPLSGAVFSSTLFNQPSSISPRAENAARVQTSIPR